MNVKASQLPKHWTTVCNTLTQDFTTLEISLLQLQKQWKYNDHDTKLSTRNLHFHVCNWPKQRIAGRTCLIQMNGAAAFFSHRATVSLNTPFEANL